MQKNKGIFLAAALAAVATLLGNFFPLIGSAVFAILIGLIINNTIGVPLAFHPGVKYTSKKVLQWSVILLGFTLSIQNVTEVGLESLGVTLTVVTVAFVMAFLAGKWLGVSDSLKTLIGAGTAICGGSAIAAVSPIIEADEDETALSISTIFLFNLVAVFLFPFFGHLMNMSNTEFGLWAGTAINDTSSVVAAGYSYSEAAGDYATIVKLTRATLIIPVSLLVAGIRVYRNKETAKKGQLKRIFPWFILWFLVASILTSTGLIPDELQSWAKTISRFMIAMALGAVGLNANIKDIVRTGSKPVLLGLITWVSVAAASLAVQYIIR